MGLMPAFGCVVCRSNFFLCWDPMNGSWVHHLCIDVSGQEAITMYRALHSQSVVSHDMSPSHAKHVSYLLCLVICQSE